MSNNKSLLDNNKALARAYFSALIAGSLPDELVTKDMTAWTTLGGNTDKHSYQVMIKMLRAMCPEHLEFKIHSLTAEEDRVVVEAESKAVLLNGEDYNNTYIFVFRIRDHRIAHISEHFNACTVQEKLIPLMKLLPTPALSLDE